MPTLSEVEAEILKTLKTVSALRNARDKEPLGVIPDLPCAYFRWLGPNPIVDAETGPGQDVTHAWRLGIDVGVIPHEEEAAQDELKTIVQAITAAFRADPRLASTVDNTRLRLTGEAEYFHRASLAGDVVQGPTLYGCVFRLEADFTET